MVSTVMINLALFVMVISLLPLLVDAQSLYMVRYFHVSFF